MILDLIIKTFKAIWKYSGMIGILVIALCIELVVVWNWRQDQLRYSLNNSDLCIISVEPVIEDTELGYMITIRNEGSNQSRIPEIKLNYDDDSTYLEAVDLYSELYEENEYRYSSTIIPGRTEVEIYYPVGESSWEDIENASEISLQFDEFYVINAKKYYL